MRKACIRDRWKVAKIIPLYKKGQLLDPGNYRMLAVSGTLYLLYANNVLRVRLSQTGVKLGIRFLMHSLVVILVGTHCSPYLF